jgi:ketosteroid isomerase-like protein
MSALDKWHAYMEAPSAEGLAAMLADDVVFESPVVHTPQVGKDITFKYLWSAAKVLGGDGFVYLNERMARPVCKWDFGIF